MKLAACIDCYQVNANDGIGGLDLSEDRAQEILEGFDQFEEEYFLFNAYDEPHFSMNPCQVCGSALGGDRFILAAGEL